MLGFYAAVLVILEAGVVGSTAVLATESSLHYLIPWTLGFGALVLIGLIGVVVAMNVRDPTKLQLGRVSGREFLDYQRVTRGDSIAGEYVEEIPEAIPPALPGEARAVQRPAIEPGLDKAEEPEE